MYASKFFDTVTLNGRNMPLTAAAEKHRGLPEGGSVFWGVPFDCADAAVYVDGLAYKTDFDPVAARYLIFLHASETPSRQPDAHGIYRNFRGVPAMCEHICDYIIAYADGSSETVPIHSRMEVNDMDVNWGNGAMLAKNHIRGHSFQTATDDIYNGLTPAAGWGNSQTRVRSEGSRGAQVWIYAYENPKPDVKITGIEIVKQNGNIWLFGVTAGQTAAHPLRYGRRRKCSFELAGDPKNPFSLVDIDMGHIISVTPLRAYDNAHWETGPAFGSPEEIKGKYIVEYDAHEDAVFYLGENRTPLPVKDAARDDNFHIEPAERPVKLRVVDNTGRPVPVRIHAHGRFNEYLPPKNRHRIPNPHWFEDYSTDLVKKGHWSTYIDGTAEYDLPLGEVFFEATKGFEIKPIRRRFVVNPDTDEIVIELERVINWRKNGWVTADTHVHFLSPQTALLEGEAEGVNVVNLLASQWGELFTNVGDFTGDGETAKGDYMVRVGTENRQHILGHISLLGYNGPMILPLTTGGPDESAQGDPIETTLTQWAEQCRRQNGVVILPHFPNPRAENAAAIVSDLIDGVEVTMLGSAGINPYYLSDWYRYLNCGYQIAAVGGTDKMGAYTAVGEMRTYALIDGPLTYRSWADAVTAGKTFATNGALVNFNVEGQCPGGRLELKNGGKLNIEWAAASATIPITKVELVMNGDTVDGVSFDGFTGEKNGVFTVDVKESAWLALRVRGRHAGCEEIITAHTSAVFVLVDGKNLYNAPDAASILDQIEGATAYIKTLATPAIESQFKLALAALAGAHRALHNRMHAAGHFHNHNPEDRHPGH